MNLQPSSHRRINDHLCSISSKYHDSIPLETIFGVLRKEGVEVLQEDGTSWEGFLCGENSHTTFPLNVKNHVLSLSWYKMESGRWEIVSYLS